MSDLVPVFSTLAGVGATLVAFTGGLYVQRLTSLRSEVDGAIAQQEEARRVRDAAEAELATIDEATQVRYRQLASGDPRFLDELFANVRDERAKPSEPTAVARQARLGWVLQPYGSSLAAWPSRDDDMKSLWDFADYCYDLGVEYEPDLNHPHLAVPMEMLSQTLPMLEPSPAWIIDAESMRDRLVEAVARQAWAENLGELTVQTRLDPALETGERRYRLARFRDELKVSHLSSARLPLEAADKRLQDRQQHFDSIRIPQVPSHLHVEAGVFLLMMLLLVVTPIMFVIPSLDESRTLSTGTAVTVGGAFFLGLVVYLIYLLASATQVTKRASTKEN